MIKVCEYCGKEYEAGDNGFAKLKKYCSEKCRIRAEHVRKRVRAQATKYENIDLSTAYVCKQCGRWFRPVEKKRNHFCSRECALKYKHEHVHRVRRVCLCCGKEYYAGDASHKDKRFCSSKCFSLYHEQEMVCEWCGSTFKSGNSTQKYCSEECGYKANLKNKREKHVWKPRKVRICERCGKFYTSKGNAPHDKYCSRYCQTKVRNSIQRAKKRTKKHGIVIEPIEYLDIYARDGGICYLCGEPVTRDYDCHDKKSGTLDHVIPLAKGGDHTHDNVRLACMMCNSIKRDKAVGANIPTARGK